MDDIVWSDDEESILRTIGDKCFSMSEVHKKNYVSLQDKLKYYKIPVIIISGINSVIAVGLNSYVSQDVISITNCVLALSCGIIGSIELYLKLAENMNKEYLSGREFYLLHIDIKKTLALSQQNRKVDGHVYLETIYNKYIKTVSNAEVMIGNDLYHDFKEHNKKVDIKIIKNNLEKKIVEKIEMTNLKEIENLNDDEEENIKIINETVNLIT